MPTYTAPTTRASGFLVTASVWNTDIVENIKYFKDAPVFDTAAIIGAATTAGIRLDLESGVLAVREGDDSAYGPMRALSVQTTTSGTLVSAQVQSTLQASFGAFDGPTNASAVLVGATRGVLLIGGQSASATSGLGPIKWIAGVRSQTDENTARIVEIGADSLTGTSSTGGDFYISTRPTSGNLTECFRAFSNGTIRTLSTVSVGNATPATTGAGITFPAAQSASSDANTLDDYEEGTWTATLKGGTTDPTTPVTVTGNYTKIGRQVTITAVFLNVTTTGASGNVSVTGAPFSSSGISTGAAMSHSFDLNGGTGLTSYISGTTIELFSMVDDAAWAQLKHNAGTNRSLWFTITYFV